MFGVNLRASHVEIDRMAPIRWLLALKYLLLSGAEMSGSSGGLGMDMRASITYLHPSLEEGMLRRSNLRKWKGIASVANAPSQ